MNNLENGFALHKAFLSQVEVAALIADFTLNVIDRIAAEDPRSKSHKMMDK